MIKKLAWNTFKNTGNINTFLELVKVEDAEKNLQKEISNQSRDDTTGFLNCKDNSNFNDITNVQNKDN